MTDVLTREELEHYKQHMRVASDAGDLWSDEYDAFSRVCDEVLALRAERESWIDTLKHNAQLIARADAAEAEVERLTKESALHYDTAQTLLTQNARLREALREIVRCGGGTDLSADEPHSARIAAAALKGANE